MGKVNKPIAVVPVREVRVQVLGAMRDVALACKTFDNGVAIFDIDPKDIPRAFRHGIGNIEVVLRRKRVPRG